VTSCGGIGQSHCRSIPDAPGRCQRIGPSAGARSRVRLFSRRSRRRRRALSTGIENAAAITSGEEDSKTDVCIVRGPPAKSGVYTRSSNGSKTEGRPIASVSTPRWWCQRSRWALEKRARGRLLLRVVTGIPGAPQYRPPFDGTPFPSDERYPRGSILAGKRGPKRMELRCAMSGSRSAHDLGERQQD